MPGVKEKYPRENDTPLPRFPGFLPGKSACGLRVEQRAIVARTLQKSQKQPRAACVFDAVGSCRRSRRAREQPRAPQVESFPKAACRRNRTILTDEAGMPASDADRSFANGRSRQDDRRCLRARNSLRQPRNGRGFIRPNAN
jgi:hypothetical protein